MRGALGAEMKVFAGMTGEEVARWLDRFSGSLIASWPVPTNGCSENGPTPYRHRRARPKSDRQGDPQTRNSASSFLSVREVRGSMLE
jgi:hypothetical protein